MWRTLPVCALLLSSLAVHAADAPVHQMVIRMSVQPKPAPKPALKYQLLPELREMQPGNPIQGYLKSFMEQAGFYHNKEESAKRDQWLVMPLNNLPLQEMQYYKTNCGLRQADWAARLDMPDWQILLQLRRDGVNTLLPDAQKMRALANALKVRFRLEIAERKFDDALYTAKTMLALSRHFIEHPTLIGNLVGIAIASLTLDVVDEMIQQPGCPNLFWALTDLPSPFLDLRKGLQGERMWILTELPSLDDREPLTETQMKKIVDRLQKAINGPAWPQGSVRAWLEARAKNKDHVRAARKRLVEGLEPADAAKFDSFPPLQIVLLDEKLTHDVQRDEEFKALALPYWQARAVMDASPPWNKGEKTPLMELIVTAIKVKAAQARLDQRIGLLRCVEALRMYAAAHDGKLPAKLDDIRLPLPVDAATGKPFVYKLAGKTAHLQGAPFPGIQYRYEVTIAK